MRVRVSWAWPSARSTRLFLVFFVAAVAALWGCVFPDAQLAPAQFVATSHAPGAPTIELTDIESHGAIAGDFGGSDVAATLGETMRRDLGSRDLRGTAGDHFVVSCSLDRFAARTHL